MLIPLCIIKRKKSFSKQDTQTWILSQSENKVLISSICVFYLEWMFSVWFSSDRENYAYKDEIIYTFWRFYCINITVICIITMHETGCSFKWNGPLVLKERGIGRWGRFVFFARKGKISFSTSFLRWLFSFSITIYCVNLE